MDPKEEDLNNDFDFFAYYAQLNHQNLILSYKGPLTDVLLAEFSRDIREKLKENRKAGKKVFSVFMELSQNVLFYSKEINHFGDQDKVGTLVILQTENEYRVITGNLITTESASILLDKWKTVISLDRDALRDYKRKLRDAPREGESKGAGIGLVQVALTSDDLEVKIKRINDKFSFFALFANIAKGNKPQL
ncbi:SiaB family protein kinase [Microscilla marina]|uniref:Uncharacterized protein n=1 Tax=Microscilla marina ATCC 23134 TaxID=313606 RepID=A1ZVQ6_MICM2|nr:SiaB family protein kinase [Microscilla marina]EAY25599.1 conserved hypothetical protein [Microscilla marina ATCC 23134]